MDHQVEELSQQLSVLQEEQATLRAQYNAEAEAGQLREDLRAQAKLREASNSIHSLQQENKDLAMQAANAKEESAALKVESDAMQAKKDSAIQELIMAQVSKEAAHNKEQKEVQAALEVAEQSRHGLEEQLADFRTQMSGRGSSSSSSSGGESARRISEVEDELRGLQQEIGVLSTVCLKDTALARMGKLQEELQVLRQESAAATAGATALVRVGELEQELRSLHQELAGFEADRRELQSVQERESEAREELQSKRATVAELEEQLVQLQANQIAVSASRLAGSTSSRSVAFEPAEVSGSSGEGIEALAVLGGASGLETMALGNIMVLLRSQAAEVGLLKERESIALQRAAVLEQELQTLQHHNDSEVQAPEAATLDIASPIVSSVEDAQEIAAMSEAMSRVAELQAQLEEMKQELATTHTESCSSLKREEEAAERLEQTLLAKMSDLQNELKAVQEELRLSKRQNQELQGADEREIAAYRQVNKLKGGLKGVREELATLEIQMHSKSKEIEQAERQAAIAELELCQLSTQLQLAQQELELMRTRLYELEESKEHEKQTALAASDETIAHLRTELAQAHDTKQELKGADEREIAAFRKVNKLQAELKGLHNELAAVGVLSLELAEANKRDAQSMSRIQELEEDSARTETLTAACAALEEDLKRLQQYVPQLEDANKQLKELQLSEAQAIERVAEVQGELATAKEERAESWLQIKALEGKCQELEGVSAQEQAALDRVGELEAEIRQLQTKVITMESNQEQELQASNERNEREAAAHAKVKELHAERLQLEREISELQNSNHKDQEAAEEREAIATQRISALEIDLQQLTQELAASNMKPQAAASDSIHELSKLQIGPDEAQERESVGSYKISVLEEELRVLRAQLTTMEENNPAAALGMETFKGELNVPPSLFA